MILVTWAFRVEDWPTINNPSSKVPLMFESTRADELAKETTAFESWSTPKLLYSLTVSPLIKEIELEETLLKEMMIEFKLVCVMTPFELTKVEEVGSIA